MSLGSNWIQPLGTLHIVNSRCVCVPTIRHAKYSERLFLYRQMNKEKTKTRNYRFGVLLFDIHITATAAAPAILFLFSFGLIHLIKKQFTEHDLTYRLRFCTQNTPSYPTRTRLIVYIRTKQCTQLTRNANEMNGNECRRGPGYLPNPGCWFSFSFFFSAALLMQIKTTEYAGALWVWGMSDPVAAHE